MTFSKFANLEILLLKMHYDGTSLVTVLSMKHVANLKKIVVIMQLSKSIIVKEEKIIKFFKCQLGLYFINTVIWKIIW